MHHTQAYIDILIYDISYEYGYFCSPRNTYFFPIYCDINIFHMYIYSTSYAYEERLLNLLIAFNKINTVLIAIICQY